MPKTKRVDVLLDVPGIVAAAKRVGIIPPDEQTAPTEKDHGPVPENVADANEELQKFHDKMELGDRPEEDGDGQKDD